MRREEERGWWKSENWGRSDDLANITITTTLEKPWKYSLTWIKWWGSRSLRQVYINILYILDKCWYPHCFDDLMLSNDMQAWHKKVPHQAQARPWWTPGHSGTALSGQTCWPPPWAAALSRPWNCRCPSRTYYTYLITYLLSQELLDILCRAKQSLNPDWLWNPVKHLLRVVIPECCAA